MIQKQTALVLGAGASRPYGFLTALEMVAATEREIVDPVALSPTLMKAGFSDGDLQAFFRSLKGSGFYSMDAFVQRRKAPAVFRDIAKAVMITQILPIEIDAHLCGQAENTDWYRYLFAGMCPTSPNAFPSNRLKVITFNFDRSFERRLFLTLKDVYGVNDHDAAKLASSIEVLHIHGQLGACAWLDEGGRDYEGLKDPAVIAQCVGQIHVVDEEIAPAVLTRAQTILDEAEVICFLGFSFHPDNLNRLNARILGNKTLCGTRKDMSEASCGEVYRCFNSPRRDYLYNCAARQFFDRFNLFG